MGLLSFRFFLVGVFLVLDCTDSTGYPIVNSSPVAPNVVRVIPLPAIFKTSPILSRILQRRNISISLITSPEVVRTLSEKQHQEKKLRINDQTERSIGHIKSDESPSEVKSIIPAPAPSGFSQLLFSITNSVLNPWIEFNNRLSKTAGTLPALFAAKGERK